MKWIGKYMNVNGIKKRWGRFAYLDRIESQSR